MSAYKSMALLYLYNELGDDKMKQQLSMSIQKDEYATDDLIKEAKWIGD